MSKTAFAVLAAALALLPASGCGKIGGPRFWWDDRVQERLPDGYRLPDDPAAPSETGVDRRSSPSGSDLTEDSLRDYRANRDLEEERRQSESGLFDF